MASRSAASTVAAGARRCTASTPSTTYLGPSQSCRAFSTTPPLEKTTKGRRNMYRWMAKFGRQFEDSTQARGPSYLMPSQPFPKNPFFASESVLGPSMRSEIAKRVWKDKQPIKVISVQLGVDPRRIAAVLRLKAIEQQWRSEGKPLATPYQDAMMKMLPVHHHRADDTQGFEPIHEQHIHKLTMQQLFVPVAESREFGREDAAKAFHRSMLSPDKRSPHPELVKMQKSILEGGSMDEGWQTFVDEVRAEEDALVAKAQAKRAEAESKISRVDKGRFEFRFKDVNVDLAGSTGRGRGATGVRYGVPFNDRRKGAVKIPTSAP